MTTQHSTVYDAIEIPLLRISMKKGVTRGVVVGLCMGVLSVLWVGDDFGTQAWPLVCAFLLVFFASVGLGITYFVTKRQRAIETQIRHTRHQREYWTSLDSLVGQAPDARSNYVARWRAAYTPEKGERVLWGSGGQYGEHDAAGSNSTRDALLPEHMEHVDLERLSSMWVTFKGERGFLILTSTGIRFVSQDKRVQWRAAWSEIERCTPTLNALVIHPHDQPARVFDVDYAGYDSTCSPQFLDALVMECLSRPSESIDG